MSTFTSRKILELLFSCYYGELACLQIVHYKNTQQQLLLPNRIRINDSDELPTYTLAIRH